MGVPGLWDVSQLVIPTVNISTSIVLTMYSYSVLPQRGRHYLR
jgi:hypothetical protein